MLMKVIEKRRTTIRSFSGRARAVATIKGDNESVLAYINYKRPDLYRIILKGSFGVVLAVITSQQDSTTVYIPSLKGYFVVSNEDNKILQHLIPDISFDFRKLTLLFTGVFPSETELENSKILMNRTNSSAILSIVSDFSLYEFIKIIFLILTPVF